MVRFALLWLTPFVLFAQDATLSLAGNVVDSGSGEPIAHALVILLGFPKPDGALSAGRRQNISRSALTDAGGAFRFLALPAGNYSVSAQKPGYESGGASVAVARSRMIDLQSSVEDLRVGLAAFGDITGKVVDDHDEPMRGVSINLVTSQVVDGLRQNKSVRTVNTDDRGQYRFWNLSPGKYFLRATGQGGGNVLSGAANAARLDVGDSFAPIYFGGAKTVGSASPVEVSSGSHATADFRLQIEPAWRIHATLRNANPRENVTFALVINGEEVGAGPDRSNRDTGAIEFKDVVAGVYVLRADQGTMSGEVAVNVAGADAENAVLTLYPAADIPVTVRFTNPVAQAPAKPAKRRVADDDDDGDEDSEVRSDQCMVYLSAISLDGSARPARTVVMQDGVLHDVMAGKHRVSIQCFDGYVRSALAGTQDLLANPVINVLPGATAPPIEILATHGGGKLTTKLDTSIQSGFANLQILLMPQFSGTTGPEHREINNGARQSTSPFTFAFNGLAPGTYAIYAFGSTNHEYRNAEFLKSLSGGQTIQIDDGSEKEITIDKVMP